MSAPYELLLVGGGLQNAFIALAVLHARPDARLLVLEAEDRLGGSHTWSFHDSDVPPEAEAFLAPLRQHVFAGHEVRFPGYERQSPGGYSSFDGAHLHATVTAALEAAPQAALRLSSRVTAVDGRGATLPGGERIEADLVVDGRGPGAAGRTLGYVGGWQKFVGRVLELSCPHGQRRPILMDATVPQVDGFRFVYVLPLSPTRLLVEDTCFSSSETLDAPAMIAALDAYCAARDWAIAAVLREERGVLPMPASPPTVSYGPALAGGYAGGWFHPGTGYSTPVALRLACFIAARPADEVVGADLRLLAKEIEGQQRYAVLLNELLFLRCPPEARRGVLRRFYDQPEEVVARWFALRTTRADRVRGFLGAPPRGVSIPGAASAVLRYARERRSWRTP